MLESDLNEVADSACRILATGRPVTDRIDPELRELEKHP